MASSSKTSCSDDQLNTDLIFKHISDLQKRLTEVKQWVSQFDGGNWRLCTHVDASCQQLAFIKDIFTKLIELRNYACIGLHNACIGLDRRVGYIFGEIKEASNGPNPAGLIRTRLQILTGDFVDVNRLLPSSEELSSLVSQAKRITTDIGDPVDPSSKSLAPYSLGRDESSFNSENFSELIGTLNERSRRFLLFFSVFPVNAVVSKRVLKNWWIGEGLLGSSFVKAEIVANKILEELMEKCFIEAVREQSRLVGFRLHPYVRPLVIHLASYNAFFAFDAEGYPSIELSSMSRACLIKFGERSTIDMLKKARDVENLETLFNINEQYPDLKLEFFSRLKNIKVLSLGKWQRDDDHDIELNRYRIVKVKNSQHNYHHIEVESTDLSKGLKKTRSLRLLSLRGISRINELPKSLCMQVDLRILDLNSCYNLEELPKEIKFLTKLTYLDVSGCYLLDRMPKEVAKLTELRVLKGFLVVNLEYSCSFLDLTGLRKLRKLSLYTNREDFPTQGEKVVFQKFQELQNLSIIWGKTIKRHRPTDESKNQVEGLGLSQVNSTNEVGGNRNTSKGKDEKKEDAGAAFKLADQSTRHDILKEGEDSVALGKGKKTVNVEGIKEGCSIASEATMEEEAAVAINTRVTGDILKQEAIASGSNTTNLSGAEANKDGGSKTSASPRKTSAIRKPILQQVLSKMPTMKLEKGNEPKPSQEVFKSLEKLDIQCYPSEEAPWWLKADYMNNLKKLYIRGGKLKDWLTTQSSESWKVEILRLKFLNNLTLDWADVQASFPKLIVVEKVECPNIKSFPMNQDGLWLVEKESSRSHQ